MTERTRDSIDLAGRPDDRAGDSAGATTGDRGGDRARDTAERRFRLAAAFYLLAWTIHTADHIRRGLFDVAIGVQVLGNLQILLTVGFAWLLWKRHPLAPVVALGIGIPVTVGIGFAHLGPDLGPFSDSLWSAGIDTFTWVAVILELLGSIALAVGGWLAWRATDFAPPKWADTQAGL